MKLLFNIIKLLVVGIVIFFALQFEYKGRKVKTYITEFPNSVIAQRTKYYVMSIITGKKDSQKEKKLFGEQPLDQETSVSDQDSNKLKSVIISN